MPPITVQPKPMATERIARRPSMQLNNSLPPQWNSSLQQCGAAILLFALATVLTQQAALGVVLLGIVRSFALLVFVAGGVMYPYSRIRAAQQARREASQEPDANVKAPSHFGPVTLKPRHSDAFGPVTLKSFPQSVSSSATSGAARRSQAPPPPRSNAGGPPLGIRHARSLQCIAEDGAEAQAEVEAEAVAEVEAWPTSRSRLARATDADAAAFLASPPTEAGVEKEAQEGSAERASAMLSHLIEHSEQRPAAGAFHAVVRAHAAAGRPAQASAWLERMLATGLRPDAQVFNAAMGAHFNAAASDGGEGARALLDRMAQLQLPALRWVQGHWASHLEDIDCC
jgi:pentatricopeptide repeat protein